MTKDQLTELIVKAFPNGQDATKPPEQLISLSAKLSDAISTYVNSELLSLKEALIAQGAYKLPPMPVSGSAGSTSDSTTQTNNGIIPGTIIDYTPGK